MLRDSTIPIPPLDRNAAVYEKLAPALHQRGFNPLPIRDGTKKPSVRWRKFQSKKMTKRTVAEFASRFGDTQQVAIPTGPLHGITVVDIDGDAEEIDFALETFGYPRVMAETPSFGVHLYYQHAGEKNRNRIFDRPIDIRGAGGLVIVPGSVRGDGIYRFVEGGWDDFDSLTLAKPVLRETAHKNLKGNESSRSVVPEGIRDTTLFNDARNTYRTFMPIITIDLTPIEIETAYNKAKKAFSDHLVNWDSHNCRPPLGEAYVRNKANYLWDN